MAIQPLYDRVVVRRIEAEKTTESGIIIPDRATEKPTRGEVIAVGNGAITQSGELRPIAIDVGDHVLFTQYGGTEISVNGETLVVLKESDVLAKYSVETIQEKAA